MLNKIISFSLRNRPVILFFSLLLIIVGCWTAWKMEVDIKENAHDLSFTLFVKVKCEGKTGVEMEALTGVSVGLLTIYDMLKAIDKGMRISQIVLESKQGGKSGEFKRTE